MESLGEGYEQKFGLVTAKVEERHFGLVVAEHSMNALVVEIVANTVSTIRIVTADGDCHCEFVL